MRSIAQFFQTHFIKPVIAGTTPYTAGDAVGALISLSGVARANQEVILRSITVIDVTQQDLDLVFYLFDTKPSAADSADNAALVLAATDLQNANGQGGLASLFKVASADYHDVGSIGIANVQLNGDAGIPLRLRESGSLYLKIQTPGTPTYDVDALGIRLLFERNK